LQPSKVGYGWAKLIMANKIKEIKGFFSGIISSFSSSDIKDDAASYSENISSTDEDGVLKGSKSENIVVENESIKSSIAKSIENDDETFDLVTADSDTGKINILRNLYGQSDLANPTNSSEPGNKASSIEVKNNQAFVGYGKDIKPKIVYKTKNLPFGEPKSTFSNWIYEDSTVYDEKILNSSFSIDRFSSIPGSTYTHTDSKKAVGIRYDHKDVYLVNFAANFVNGTDVFDFAANPGTITLPTTGKNILNGGACDICQAEVDSFSFSVKNSNADPKVSNDNFKFWVLSNSGGDTEDTNSFPIIQKYSISSVDTFESLGTHTIDFGEYPPPNGSSPASILETKNYLWIQYWKPNGDKFGRKEPFLWCIKLTDLEFNTNVNAVNKSLYYDYIKGYSQKFRLNFIAQGSEDFREYYFRNIDEHYENLEDDNWLSGDSDWDDRERSWGGHKYSGLLNGAGNIAPSIKIARHGLISSPLINTVPGEDTDYLFNDFNLDVSNEDEDWVSVVGQSDPLSLNILTAKEYKVAGGNWYDSYRRLRAGDDDGGGSSMLDNHETGLLGWFVGLVSEAFSFVYNLILDTCDFIVGANGGRVLQQFIDLIFGEESVNWFYNGKCFETGRIENFIINISSNHNPLAKFDKDSDHEDGPARLHIRELSGFDNSLDIISVKHYFNRLMISCHNPNEENPIQSSKFFMYDTSMHSISNTNPCMTMVIHPDDWHEAMDSGSGVAIPDDYLAFGNTRDGTSNTSPERKPNNIIQFYTPIVDFEVNGFGTYDWHIDSLENIYPHLYSAFWLDENSNITLNSNNLSNLSTVGKVYATERAVFDIFLRAGACYDGRRIFNASPGWSSQTTINDHIGFLSTSGPLNMSKFNFLVVKNSGTDAQENLPLEPDKIFPNNSKSIISLNQYPNTSDDINIKQYSLDSKSISFEVKAQTYDGASIAPFTYADDEALNLYRYKINLVYDGYQDSPLSNHYTEVDIRSANVRADSPEPNDGTVNYRASSLAITINLHKPELLSKRITDVRLWRSTISLNESDTENDTFNIEGQYTLVDTIPLNSQWILTTESVKGYDNIDIDLGKIAYYTVVDNGTVGPSYEARVGLPEAMKITLPNYTLSTQLNGFLYIANCKHPSFEDASSLIFRSLPDKYSMFDWTENYLALPSKPRALTSFDGRIIAWDYDNMYVINPDGFYIEDTFEGSGCLGYSSFARSEQGICFADENNIYLYDGKNVNNIGIPIITNNEYSQEVSWRNKNKDYESIIKYSSIIRAFCLFFKIDRSLFENFTTNSSIADSHYNSGGQNGDTIYRWHDIPGTNIPWEGEIEYPIEFIVHKNMRNAWFQDNFNYGIPEDYDESLGDFFDPYITEHEGETISLPYGTLYDVNTKRYIVDMPAFLYGIGYYDLFQNYDADDNRSNVYVLLEGLNFSSEELFKNGNFLTNLPEFYYCFTYNVDKKRWDLQKTGEYKGIFNGSKGELYSSQKNNEDNFVLKELFSSDNKKQFSYISKNFSLSNQTVNKILSKLKIFYKYTTPKFEYMINNDDKWITPIENNISYEDYCLSYKFPKEHKKAKTIKIKLISGYNEPVKSYDTEIDSFSIIYRERGNV